MKRLLPGLMGLCLIAGVSAAAQECFITGASTTSTCWRPGLFEYLHRASPKRPASRCTSSPSAPARRWTSDGRGDAADVVFVHEDRPAEDKISSPRGLEHQALRRNVATRLPAIGPKSDPAKSVRQQGDALAGAEENCRCQGNVHFPRRQIRHASGRTTLLDGVGCRSERGQRRMVTATSARAWARLSIWPRPPRPITLSDRGTWLSFKNRRGSHRGRGGRHATVQPIWRHAGQSGQISEAQIRGRPGLRRLA